MSHSFLDVLTSFRFLVSVKDLVKSVEAWDHELQAQHALSPSFFDLCMSIPQQLKPCELEHCAAQIQHKLNTEARGLTEARCCSVATSPGLRMMPELKPLLLTDKLTA